MSQDGTKELGEIEKSWRSFKEASYGSEPLARQQYHQVKLAFFAGAAGLMAAQTRLAAYPDSVMVAALEGIEEELLKVARKLAAEEIVRQEEGA